MKLDSLNIEAPHTQRELAQTEAEIMGKADMAPPISAPPVTLTYRNWRGEVSARSIVPGKVWFGSTEWHPEPQWLLTAFDIEKGADRDFALKDFGCPERGALINAAAHEAEKRGAVGAADAIRALATGSILEPVQGVPA